MKLAGLTDALGRRPPKGIVQLPPAALEELELAVRDARVRQAEALERSLDVSLRVTPRPLRPLLRKVLLG